MQSIVRRAAVAAAVIFALPFGLVACEEADAKPKPGPSVIMAQSVARETAALNKLHAAQSCTADVRGWAKVPADLMRRCIQLGSQPRHKITFEDGSTYLTAAGPMRVAECRSQYRDAELRMCVTQPLKG